MRRSCRKDTTKPDPSTLVEKRQQRQMASTSISYTYNRKITNDSKAIEEQNNQLNNNHDQWCRSADDEFPPPPS